MLRTLNAGYHNLSIFAITSELLVFFSSLILDDHPQSQGKEQINGPVQAQSASSWLSAVCWLPISMASVELSGT